MWAADGRLPQTASSMAWQGSTQLATSVISHMCVCVQTVLLGSARLSLVPPPCPQMSDRELFDKLAGCAPAGSAHSGWVAARATLLLQQLSTTGLTTRQQCLEYLGSHFRIVLNSPDR